MSNRMVFRQGVISLSLFISGLVAGCSNQTAPEAATGSIMGRVTNPGPVDRVHVANFTIETALRSDGTFALSNVPQGPAVLQFTDSRRLSYAYAQVLVRANATSTVSPVEGPVLGPESTIPAGIAPDAVLAPGVIRGQLLRSETGNPISTATTVQLFSATIQGGPSGSVGQDPATAQPGLVAANQLGIGSSAAAFQPTLVDQTRPLVTLQPQIAATAQTDAAGRFSFPPVPPGTYFLVPGPITGFAGQVSVEVHPDTTTTANVFYDPVGL